MKIEYKCNDGDKEFLTNLKNSDNIFENKCYDIQKIWLRIHACTKELKELYMKQARLEKPEDSEWGICLNTDVHIPSKLFECSVGMIRKERNYVIHDDGLCGTCPYFVYDKELSELIGKKYLDNKKKNKKIYLIRWLRQKCNECKRDKEDNCITPDGIIESCSNCRYFDGNIEMMK